MKLLRSRRASTALELFNQTEDLVFAVNAQGIVRGSCNPAALKALQRLDTIFPSGGVGALRQCIHRQGSMNVNGWLGDKPAVWKTVHVERTDQVLVVCSAELGRLNLEASTDVLTGLANKRQFLQDLSSQLARNSLTALLLIDIDHFKRFNDQYGHVAGDTVLSAVGQVIAKNTREEDRSYRYGGEELAIRMKGLIDNTEFSRAVARTRAEAIRAGVEQLTFDDIAETVTVSIGITLYQSGSDSTRRVSEADRALYYAKDQGRNRVVFFDEVPVSWVPPGQTTASGTQPTTSPA